MKHTLVTSTFFLPAPEIYIQIIGLQCVKPLPAVSSTGSNRKFSGSSGSWFTSLQGFLNRQNPTDLPPEHRASRQLVQDGFSILFTFNPDIDPAYIRSFFSKIGLLFL
jgi:hypothetical protein